MTDDATSPAAEPIGTDEEKKVWEPLPGTGPVPHLEGRGGEYILTEDGPKHYRRKLGEPLRVIDNASKRKSIRAQVGGHSSLVLPKGLFLVYAGTGVGKSTLLRAMERRSPNIKLLKAVEPQDSNGEIKDDFMFHYADDAIAFGLKHWQESGFKSLPVIDSLRAPLYETQGAAGNKGVVMAFFPKLTRLSNALAFQGATMMATLNPMSDNVDQQAYIETMLKASLPGVLILTASAEGVFEGTVILRDGDKYRQPQPFSLLSIGEAKAPAEAGSIDVEISEADNDANPSATTALRGLV